VGFFPLTVPCGGEIVKEIEPNGFIDAVFFTMPHDNQIFIWGNVNELTMIA